MNADGNGSSRRYPERSEGPGDSAASDARRARSFATLRMTRGSFSSANSSASIRIHPRANSVRHATFVGGTDQLRVLAEHAVDVPRRRRRPLLVARFHLHATDLDLDRAGIGVDTDDVAVLHQRD